MRNIEKPLRPQPASRRSGLRGAAAIEMAIMLPLLVLIFTGMVEYGRLMWHYDALAKATRDAARYLSNEPDISAKTGAAKTMVDNAAAAAGVKDLVTDDVDVACTPNCQSPQRVTVSINYAFTIGDWVPVIGPLSVSVLEVELTPHSTMPYMR